MPWEHCQNFVLDDEVCPECGVTKAAWTVEVDATRVFVIGKPKHWVDMICRDAFGRPRASAAYRLHLSDGEVLEGRLDEGGRVYVDDVPKGPVRLELLPPERPAWVEAVPLSVPAVDTVSEPHWVELTAVDPFGRPRAGAAYALHLPDGTVRRGTLDAHGHVREDGVPHGHVRFELLPPLHAAQPDAVPAPAADDQPSSGDTNDLPHWVEFTAVDPFGRPRAGAAYALHLPDGTVRRGTLDAHGQVREDGVPHGHVRFELLTTSPSD